MKRPTLAVPADESYFDLRRVPEMLATARWPDPGQNAQVTDLRKHDGKLCDLDNADWEFLRAIWHDLPDPDFPMDTGAWQRYDDAFRAALPRPPWELVTCIDDGQLTNAMLRTMAEQDYKKIMLASIEDGGLEVRSELTLAPIDPTATVTLGAFTNGGFVIARDTLSGFAAHVGIEVQAIDGPAAATNTDKLPKLRSDREQTLLLIIRALLEKARIPKREEVSTVTALLVQLGFNVPKDDDTIRKPIQAALDLKPEHKSKGA